jgi:hypothetical protein
MAQGKSLCTHDDLDARRGGDHYTRTGGSSALRFGIS